MLSTDKLVVKLKHGLSLKTLTNIKKLMLVVSQVIQNSVLPLTKFENLQKFLFIFLFLEFFYTSQTCAGYFFIKSFLILVKSWFSYAKVFLSKFSAISNHAEQQTE